MLTFDVFDRSEAPPIEVWKLLYDASRFPDWWVGIETVEMTSAETFTYYAPGYPDFPMPQTLQASTTNHLVKISCLVSDLRFEWQLAHSRTAQQPPSASTSRSPTTRRTD